MTTTPAPVVGQVAVIALVDFAEGSRWKGIRHLMFGRWPLAKSPGLRFGKVLGSGSEGGFGLEPSASHQGLFCSFDDDATADAFLESSKHVDLYRQHGASWITFKLRAFTMRGAWSGVVPVGTSVERPVSGPVASLTRGSIRPMRARRFWSFSPPAQEAIARHPDAMLGIGLGEAPLFRQCTFSIWKSEAALADYARGPAHLAASQAAMAEGHFSESLFSRLVAYAPRGSWKGLDAKSLGLQEDVRTTPPPLVTAGD